MAFCDLFRKNILDDAAAQSAKTRAKHVKLLTKLMKRFGIQVSPENIVFESEHDTDFPNAVVCGLRFFVRHREAGGGERESDTLIAYKYKCEHDKNPNVFTAKHPNYCSGYHEQRSDGKFCVTKEVAVSRPADMKPLLE